MTELDVPKSDEGFDLWWRRNHPWDWWAKKRGGQPMAHLDRLLVAHLVRDAYDAGKGAASHEYVHDDSDSLALSHIRNAYYEWRGGSIKLEAFHGVVAAMVNASRISRDQST